MGKKNEGIICGGTIKTEQINAAHTKIRKIVEAYADVNLEVNEITQAIKDNWVGKGRDEFESQYENLIKKIDDFGDTLKDIYDALVKAEADYETADDQIRQKFVNAVQQ